MFLGLRSSLSKLPSIIKLSNVSTPLAKNSLTEKPNVIIEKVNNTSYTVNPFILLNLLNKAIIIK